MVLDVHRNHKAYYYRDGEKEVEGGMEMGDLRELYTYRYTAITRMTPALRGAAMRAILMFH